MQRGGRDIVNRVGSTVVLVHPFPDLYGSDRMLIQSIRGFRKAGLEVVVVIPEPGPLLDELRAEHVTVEMSRFPVLRKALLNPRGLSSLAARLPFDTYRIIRLLRRLQPRLVYVNTATMPHWLLAAWLSRVPSICHVHEAEEQLAPWVSTALVAPLIFASRVVTNSEATARYVADHNRLVTPKVQIIINGMDLPAHPFALCDSECKRIVVVGRLSPRKGQDIAIRATAKLLEAGHDVELELVGGAFRGYEWYKEELVLCADRLGISERVTFAGFISPVWPAYARATFVAVPSRVEPFGNVAVEALAAGRPVVAARTGGLPEIIREGETGLLFEPDDSDAMAHALKRLLDDDALASQLARVGVRVASASFTHERYQREIADVALALVR
jgi:glycosyltransferase involved in cell wall biosynthesis